jgi:hypothetical protein
VTKSGFFHKDSQKKGIQPQSVADEVCADVGVGIDAFHRLTVGMAQVLGQQVGDGMGTFSRWKL